jgi:bis(5'-nucleosyl)-tetraphosphatase (symmetrical)
MAVYAIGDIQGCYDPFRRLLDKLAFDPERDRLWLTGDLVNRGPKSLKTLRFVRDLGESVIAVLGNHDLHLLAVANGIGDPAERKGTLAKLLRADDCDELIDWLRRRPMAHFSESLNTMMVHAGVHPKWTVRKTLARAAEVQAVLQSSNYRDFLPKLYGNSPSRWSGRLTGNKRLRFIVNCLTRIRMIDSGGRLEYSHKGPPENAAKGLIPWFEAPDARWRGTRIVFGHWSSLGLIVEADLIGIDTGCVWNRELTAVRLDQRQKIVQIDCPE